MGIPSEKLCLIRNGVSSAAREGMPDRGALRRAWNLRGEAVCVGFVWGGIQIEKSDKPVTVPVSRTPHSFVWSDRVPLSNAMLQSWLTGRGGKFRAWAKLHPAAAKRLAAHNPSVVTR